MPLILTIVAYFVAAALLGLVGARFRSAALALAVLPFVGQLVFVAMQVDRGVDPSGFESMSWIPSLGVSLAFRVDAFSLLLTAMVATIGLLIVVYSSRYLRDPARQARFLALMVLFSGGMAGLVASDDLFGLFLFWEVTTVASYLLIGFDDERSQARAAALQAVLVTAAGGLVMLAGFVLIAAAAGSSSIATIVSGPPSGTTVTVGLGFVLIGAFTKSAQFPFHFWLPGAMAAPTPASAYLHSATMVKAGIVLLLMLAPGFSDEAIWTVGVTGVGLVTMMLGAVAAMRQRDLKLLLAHGTVSQLGFMVALIGVGETGIALGVLVAHAAFKAALFLVVGVVDKGTGTRDITRLSGLGRSHPGLAATGAVAGLSMAGIPPLLGFVTKEAAFDQLIATGSWFPLAVMALASALTVAYTGRFWFGAFGTRSGVESAAPGTIDPWLLAPPALLAVVSIGFGLLPGAAATAVGEAVGATTELVLWPGWKPALAVSALVTAVGAWLFVAGGRPISASGPSWLPSIAMPAASAVYQGAVRRLNYAADFVTGIVQNGSLPVYVAIILTTVLTVPGVVWLFSADGRPAAVIANSLPEIGLAAIAVVAAFAATRAQRRMAAALLLGVVGYAIAGIFVTFGAPDLALTQLLIETFTVALFAFVLSRLPRRFGVGPQSVSHRIRIAVSLLVGVFITSAALLATSASPERSVAEFYVDNAEEAGGRNVVNVILTEFRALDTLGEITVLAAAGIGIGALVGRRRRQGRADAARAELPVPDRGRVDV
jgi:multicomponent Na+:H+ antiporter subunit A